MVIRDEANDREYYAKRALEELQQATQSTDPAAALAHLKLARAYDHRLQPQNPSYRGH